MIVCQGSGPPRIGRQTRGATVALLFLSTILFFVCTSSVFAGSSPAWIRPGKPGDPLVWGLRGGLVFGLPSPGGMDMKGPRGLIRVGVALPPDYRPQLLNYIAIEPVVTGPGSRFDRMAFSELEPSALDPGKRGKRLWVDSSMSPSGALETIRAGHAVVERLSVKIDVERFTANGAHVYLIASMDSDHPKELRLSVFSESDGPPLDELTVTATMGNYERLRRLWLKDHVEDSRQIFATYTGSAFVEHDNYPLDEMIRTADGDAIVYCTSNESSPESVPVNAAAHWTYTLPKLTQYWRVPAHDIQPDLRVRVNARRVYWGSTNPLPGGIAFENFEVRQRYIPGQTFIYGISEQEPWALDPRLSRFRQSVQSGK